MSKTQWLLFLLRLLLLLRDPKLNPRVSLANGTQENAVARFIA
jgi:hypothetical protein